MREEGVSLSILSLKADLGIGGEGGTLCLHNTRGLKLVGVVTFWPEEFLTQRRNGTEKTRIALRRCDAAGELLATHRRSHGSDDGVGDAAFEEFVQLSRGEVEVNWRVFDALDDRSFGEAGLDQFDHAFVCQRRSLLEFR